MTKKKCREGEKKNTKLNHDRKMTPANNQFVIILLDNGNGIRDDNKKKTYAKLILTDYIIIIMIIPNKLINTS